MGTNTRRLLIALAVIAGVAFFMLGAPGRYASPARLSHVVFFLAAGCCFFLASWLRGKRDGESWSLDYFYGTGRLISCFVAVLFLLLLGLWAMFTQSL